jgi:hypothetical protein
MQVLMLGCDCEAMSDRCFGLLIHVRVFADGGEVRPHVRVTGFKFEGALVDGDGGWVVV